MANYRPVERNEKDMAIKDCTIVIRINKQERDNFKAACKKQGFEFSMVLRDFMRDYIDNRK